MLEDKKKMWIVGAVGIAIVVVGMVYFWKAREEEDYLVLEGENEMEVESGNVVQNEIEEAVEKIMVHISGQVVKPGVVTLEEGARIMDAIEVAGGVTEDADLEKVNLAYLLEDAQKVYIPSKKEKEDSAYVLEGSGEEVVLSSESAKSSKKEEKLMININTAKEEELQKLDGIGNSIATRIVNYRKENGKFNSIEEIKKVGGIGESKFNKIKNYIYVK